ncbi:MAG: hypothetical protein SGJ27_29605 [Candidatus Melainabacteria bacterium]|nr:hypothetical protein [Candidatus Melainabacteria bacterium]
MKGLTSISLVALIAMMAAAPAPASAQYTPRWGGNAGANINATQANLRARIDAGIASRRLSRSEARNLKNKLSQLSRMEADMRMSGRRLTIRERNDLNNRLSRLNRDITRQLNDFEHRRVGYWGTRNNWR